jgi:hypothetical protein
VHNVVDEHETAERLLYVAPVGLGVAWIDHALPFHRSTNVTLVPPLFV